MPEGRYVVLYTKQKHQKKKRWFDGELVVAPGGLVKLCDESGAVIEHEYRSPPAVGDEFETESYLVQVTEAAASASQPPPAPARPPQRPPQRQPVAAVDADDDRDLQPASIGCRYTSEAVPPLQQHPPIVFRRSIREAGRLLCGRELHPDEDRADACPPARRRRFQLTAQP
eukprot:TRINITY_DN6731_c0_g1_i2.p3 TRINITY_DN6731_c0_g1~~TRINITY_DN6731_c0_g1_i2.p3  ORF type:complete len:171 (+),score=56.34 TRINITY_DN6731_c0_g1_i2:67-579(+)